MTPAVRWMKTCETSTASERPSCIAASSSLPVPSAEPGYIVSSTGIDGEGRHVANEGCEATGGCTESLETAHEPSSFQTVRFHTRGSKPWCVRVVTPSSSRSS